MDRKFSTSNARSAGDTEPRIYGTTEMPIGRNIGTMEKRNYGSSKVAKTRKYGSAKRGTAESQNYGKESVNPEVRKFENPLRPLMSEEEKSQAQILDLSYDFSCRIIRLYKYLNEGKLSKADRISLMHLVGSWYVLLQASMLI